MPGLSGHFHLIDYRKSAFIVSASWRSGMGIIDSKRKFQTMKNMAKTGIENLWFFCRK